MVSVAGGSGPGLDRRYRHGQLAVLCVSAVTASPPPCAPPPVCSRRRRRTMYSARRQAIVCCWLTCQPLPSLALKHRTMVGIFGSRYDMIWYDIIIWYIWYMLIFNFDFSCFYPLCFKLGQSLLIYVCIWNLIFSTLLKRAVKSKVHILKNRFYSFFKILILIFTGDEK